MTTTDRPNVDYGDRELALRNEILRGLVGSTVHGLAVSDQDDRDETGVYVEPADYVCGLSRAETHVWRTQPEGARSGPGDLDLTIYTLRHWTRLAVEGNPSILTLLFVPESELVVRSELGDELRALAPSILSQRAGWKFLGYLNGQRERMVGGGKQNRVPNRPELIERFGWDTKYGGHALRLGAQGLELVTTGRVELPMPEPWRSKVLAVRRGEVQMTDALNLIDEVAGTLPQLLDEGDTPLPPEPDYAAVNAWLISAHQRHWAHA